MVWAMLFGFGMNVLLQGLWHIPDVFSGIQPISEKAVFFLRKRFPKQFEDNNRVGLLFTLFFLCCSILFYMSVLMVCNSSPFLLFVMKVIMCYQLIASGFTCEESLRIHKALRARDFWGAKKVALPIISSTPWPEDDQFVIKVAIDKMVRSFGEGVIGLLFYMMIGDIWLAVPYAAINSIYWWMQNQQTTDIPQRSIISILYSLLNFVPNYITGWFSIVALYALGMNGKAARHTLAHHRSQVLQLHPYRALIACMGAMDNSASARLLGNESEQPSGVKLWETESQDILRTYYVMLTSSVIALIVFSIIRLMV